MELTAINYAMQLLASIPMIIQSGRDVVATIQNGRDKLDRFKAEGRGPTPAEWTELDDLVTGLRAELHDQPGTFAGAAPRNQAPLGTPLVPGQAGGVTVPGAPGEPVVVKRGGGVS